MITTRESINYQFSLIFGYSSPKDIIVGDVIGPSKLTNIKVNELSKEVIKFLRMYNAILRDYTGSELFFIEFELYNFDEKNARTNIYPKSMLLIPGKYKDCESLLLALKPETGFLNVHKSRASIDNVSKLFFEIEEFASHPELDNSEKSHLLKIFASRFSKKLFGELIEDKWNKKLIGISTSLPTDNEMLSKYGIIKSNVEILWNDFPFKFKLLNPEYQKNITPFEGQMAIEHMKYLISGPSSYFVIENTLKLGTNLINLANTGTIDDTFNRILEFLINSIKEDLESYKDPRSITWLISYFEDFLKTKDDYLNHFSEYAQKFIMSGEKGNLTYLLNKLGSIIENQTKNTNFNLAMFYEIAKFSIFQKIDDNENLIAIDLSSALNYFFEIFKRSFDIIKKTLPHFLYRRELTVLLISFINKLNKKFEHEKKPAKILAQRLIEKYKVYLKNKIEFNSLVLSENYSFDMNLVYRNFKKIINDSLSEFFKGVNLNIGDLISFAEIQMEKNPELIKNHLVKFEKFSNEIEFIVSYILRYSTINRFLKNEDQNEIADPVTFANKFHRFLEKRIGGINLLWKDFILKWIKDYAKKFFKIEEKRDWSLAETFADFITYIEDRKNFELQATNFLSFLDNYIAQIQNQTEKIYLLEFYKQFDYCIEIRLEFPKYIRKKIETEFNLLNLEGKKTQPIKFLSINEDQTFYSHIKENEIKYFSKLIPRPKSIILKHNLTNEEKDLFRNDLFHVINFKYWHNKSQFELSDNFKEVYREWFT